MNNYLCFASIIGIELPPNTTYEIGIYTISNEVDLLIKKCKTFPLHFFIGNLEFEDLLKGTYISYYDDIENLSHLNAYDNNIAGLLGQLWRMKDNSIFVKYFYYLGSTTINRSKLNYNCYKASGDIVPTSFSKIELENVLELADQHSNFLSTKDYSKFKFENIDNHHITIADHLLEYNELGTIERATIFLFEARKMSRIPLKITNYVAFLECIFSTSSTEIQYQVAQRCSFFIQKYLNIEKLPIFNIIKDAYSVRSSYIHGAILTKVKTKEKLIPLSIELDQICRNVFNLIITHNLTIFESSDKKLLANYFQELIFQETPTE